MSIHWTRLGASSEAGLSICPPLCGDCFLEPLEQADKPIIFSCGVYGQTYWWDSLIRDALVDTGTWGLSNQQTCFMGCEL